MRVTLSQTVFMMKDHVVTPLGLTCYPLVT